MRQRIRLSEGKLYRIIKESVRRILRESSNYGIEFEDTLNWVMNKKPEISPEEQKRFALNILKKEALSTKNYWGPMGVILPNGDLLSVWDGEDIDGTYGSVGSDNVYINGYKIGEIYHYSPLVITGSVGTYWEEIKGFNKLIREQAQEGLEMDGVEYYEQ